MKKHKSVLSPFNLIVRAAIDEITCVKTGEIEKVMGLKTGSEELDKHILGLRNGRLILLGACRGVGLSSICFSIAMNVAKKQKKTVAYFSMTGNKMGFAKMFLSSVAESPLTNPRSNSMQVHELLKLKEGPQNRINIWLSENSCLTVKEIEDAVLRLEGGIDLIIIDPVDYLTFRTSVPKRNEELKIITQQIKGLAQSLDVPVIITSILESADVVQERKPTAVDFRYPGILQNTDIAMIVHRIPYDIYEIDDLREAESKRELIIFRNEGRLPENIITHFDYEKLKFRQ